MGSKNKKKQNSNGVLMPTNDIRDSLDGDSPLRIFSEAKDKINCIYQRLDDCVGKAYKFYSDPKQLDPEIAKEVNLNELQRLNRSVIEIRGPLARNQMKVAFFGRTSNGKSTVINAILHDEILPMSDGHTTGCFLQIQGNQENEAFMIEQKNDTKNNSQTEKRRSIESVSEYNALNSGDELDCSTFVKIYWPISKCPVLKYDVVLVDSPGIDVEENLDNWIDEYCRDADVFVFVLNAQSTLNRAEKHFFQQVSKKLSKPNIFILHNRWDRVADDPDLTDQVRTQVRAQVRKQHTDRAVKFLSDELNVSTKEEAEQRTYFVSAKETLQSRCSKKQNDVQLGYEDRCQEFKSFERRFEESLSKSAVQTKFQKHTDKGKETIRELSTILIGAQKLVKKVSKEKLIELSKNQDRLKKVHMLFYNKESCFWEKKIDEIKSRIEAASNLELDYEIRKLSRIVEDFDRDFNLSRLQEYKEQLYLHVEESLSKNISFRIHNVASKHVNEFKQDMHGISLLLSQQHQQPIRNIVETRTYVQDNLFDIKMYRGSYTGFEENLEFRFSLGLVSIIRKFQSRFSSVSTNQYAKNNSSQDIPQGKISVDTDFLSILERFMMNPPQSPTTVGSLAIGGVLVRTVGWRIIVVTSVVYGVLYAYEYLTWTNSAKERAFKAQYVKYARKGLQFYAPFISKQVANSIGGKLEDTFTKVGGEVRKESEEMENRIGLLKNCLDKLRLCDEITNTILGEKDVLFNELVTFATSFLST